MTSHTDWIDAYRRLLPNAVCIDIETCHWNGPVAVVGIYKPKEGVIEVLQLVRGQTLNTQTLCDALRGVKLILTFNGNQHDLPKLMREFPAAIPPLVVSLDLYEIAQKLDLKAGLKLLEGQFGIDRPEWQQRKRHIAVKLWRAFAEHRCEKALQSLLEYNAQDAANLYILAEKFAKLAESTSMPSPRAA
jgi:uncharacterized protein YprB with RNaseH-like and TPR domain